MKFSSEDLMKAMGLSVGDKVKCNNKTYTIIKLHNSYFLDANQSCWISIAQLIDEDVEILPRPKRVGELKCGEYGKQNCGSCPIRAICVSDEYNDDTLYKKLELSHKFAKDQEIHDLLKARLDKEVVE